MFKSRKSILFLMFMIPLSNTALEKSCFVSHYDTKVKYYEPSCRLVSHPNLPENRRTLAGRPCMCDKECVLYKDCCKDSKYYSPNDQSTSSCFHCSETLGVYIVNKCPSNWQDQETKYLCEKSTQPLENGDISMTIPILNMKTRQVYGNRFCAACNNDADTKNWIRFPVGVISFVAPSGYLEPECDNPNIISNSAPSILLDLNLVLGLNNNSVINGHNTAAWPLQLQTIVPTTSDGNAFNTFGRKRRDIEYSVDFGKCSPRANEICTTARFCDKYKEFISLYDNQIYICRFGALLPENSELYTRRCVPFLKRKCPDDYDHETIKEECSLYTNIVYNKKNKIPYRNVDCARCYGEKEKDLTGEPQDTRNDLGVVVPGQGSNGLKDGSPRGPYGPEKTSPK